MNENENFIDFTDDYSNGIDNAFVCFNKQTSNDLSSENFREAMNNYRQTIRNYILFEEGVLQ